VSNREYEAIGSISDISVKTYAPTNADIIAGIPNFNTILRFAFLPTRYNLNALLRKWTMAVNEMANSSGKKMANMGTRIVPSPKPEKNVRPEPINEKKQIVIYSTTITITET
jgi:hypothetical protein